MEVNMRVTVLIDNIPSADLEAEWGLSFHIEFEGRQYLLDTGASGLFAENADKLGIDLAKVEAAVLSHAHHDHADGMAAFFERNTSAKLYIRKGAKENCYTTHEAFEDGPETIENQAGRSGITKNPAEGSEAEKRYAIEYCGIEEGLLSLFADRIEYVDGDYTLAENIYLIPHKVGNFKLIGEKAKMYVKCCGGYETDTFAHEQSLVFRTKRGLVIFNSCSHTGADNIIREIQQTFPGEQVVAIIGGFHLYKSNEAEVRAFARRVLETGIEKVVTGHCTGNEAYQWLKEELGDRLEQTCSGKSMSC